jgi:hypothetical protein
MRKTVLVLLTLCIVGSVVGGCINEGGQNFGYYYIFDKHFPNDSDDHGKGDSHDQGKGSSSPSP